MGNNPQTFTDPDGDWIHIAIGAVVGGVLNVVNNLDNIKDLQDGLVAFGIGAGAGAIAAATGGAVLGALGTASSVGGFMLNAGIATGTGGLLDGTLRETGNALYFGDANFDDALRQGISTGVVEAGIGLVGGAATAGLGNLFGLSQFKKSIQIAPQGSYFKSTGTNTLVSKFIEPISDAGLSVAQSAAKSSTSLVKTGTQFSKHSIQRMAQRGVTPKMAQTAISKGQKFYDPLNKSINYILL